MKYKTIKIGPATQGLGHHRRSFSKHDRPIIARAQVGTGEGAITDRVEREMRGELPSDRERTAWEMNDGQPSGKTLTWWQRLKRSLRMTRS